MRALLSCCAAGSEEDVSERVRVALIRSSASVGISENHVGSLRDKFDAHAFFIICSIL